MTSTVTATVAHAAGSMPPAVGYPWALLIGALLTVAVAVGRHYLKRVPDELVPWAVLALTVLGSIGYGLSQGTPWPTALVSGITAAAATIGTWETGGKFIRGAMRRRTGSAKTDAPPA